MTKVAEEWVDEHILPAVTAWHEKHCPGCARIPEYVGDDSDLLVPDPAALAADDRTDPA